MPDILLAKPAAGASQNIVCVPKARFVFDFSTDEATLSRVGDNLVITFEDGGTLQLENFYTAYSGENMPSFSVEDVDISGQDFFMAMNEPDLMPAAGPAANAGNQSNGNRFHHYENTPLLGGLDRLDGLDIGWSGSDATPDEDGADGEGTSATEPRVVPGETSGKTLEAKPQFVSGTIPDEPVEVEPEIVRGTTSVQITTCPTREGTENVVFEVQLSNESAPSYENGTTVQVQIGNDTYEVAVNADGHGTLTISHGNGEDMYKDSGSITATVTGVTGGNFEHVKLGQTATANIEDTIDPATVSLSATEVTNGQYGVTAKVDNPPRTALELKLSNGGTITIEAGKTQATQTFTYDGETTVSVTGVAGQTDADGNDTIDYDEAGPGFYETLDYSSARVDFNIAAHGEVTSYDDDTRNDSHHDRTVTITDLSVGTLKGFADGSTTSTVYQHGKPIGEFSIADGQLFFTQTESYTHALDEDSAVINQVIPVINAAGATCNISVDITVVDSRPEAVSDVIDVTKDIQYWKAEGDLLANDQRSADGTTQVHAIFYNGMKEELTGDSATITGNYGTLTVHKDGSYTYTIKANMDIPETETLQDTFSYEIIDGDGDVSPAAASLTLLIGHGTLHVKESKTTVDERGHETTKGGILTDRGDLDTHILNVTLQEDQVTYSHPDLLDDEHRLTFGSYTECANNTDYDHVFHTNYGELYVNTDTGKYEFRLADTFADPLPEDFTITIPFTMTTKDDSGSQGIQNIVVVIEGTNDQGMLTEAGKGGHHSNQMWLDAKASGTNTAEDPYDAMRDPNLHESNKDSGDTTPELNQDASSRVITWLPFTMQDVDFGESVKFEAVYNGAYHENPGAANMEGLPLMGYRTFLESYSPNNSDGSIALAVAWNEFTRNFTDNQLEDMLFYKTDCGIFAIVKDTVGITGTGINDPHHWLAFIADSDSPVLRSMGEGANTSYQHGIIYKFSFQVRDSHDEIVRTSVTTQNNTNTTYAETNNVCIHVYGSNNSPTIKIENGAFIIHDDDISQYASTEVVSNNTSISDTEEHRITIKYDGNEYSGKLQNGNVKLSSHDSNITLFVNIQINTEHGTTYMLDDIRIGISDNISSHINGDIDINVTDKYSNTAHHILHIEDGKTISDVDMAIELHGSGDSDSLYGGSVADKLYGHGGNDNLWGLDGEDYLYGGSGNDRLYGGDGNDMLFGDGATDSPGTDILIGGTGNDDLDGGDGDDVLLGDGQGGFQSLVEGTVNAETFQQYLAQQSTADLEAIIKKYDAMDEAGGDDRLYGGDGDDILIGGDGNDYLDGGKGEDTLFGGSGNDIMAYDRADYLIDGGSGIDFMMSPERNLSLDALLHQSGRDGNSGPIVNDVDVLITGDKALDLTRIDQLKAYGISVDNTADGETLTLATTQWEQTENGQFQYTGADGVNLTLETNLAPVSSGEEAEAETLVFILNNCNG